MLIQLLKLVVVKDHPGLSIGQPFECNVSIARDLIIEGIAEAVDPVQHAAQLAQQSKGLSVHGHIEVREPEIEERDPQPSVVKITKRKQSALP